MIRDAIYLGLFAIAFAASTLHAQDWSLTTADFQTQPAQLKGVSQQGVTITDTDTKSDRIVTLDQFVSIERLQTEDAPVRKYTLLLSNGDRLVGQPGAVLGDKLTWISPSLGNVPISFSRLVMIGKGDPAAAPDEAPKQDQVTLANGDTAAGVFTNCGDDKVVLQTDSGATSIPLASVTRIAFAATGAVTTDTARAFRVHLTDGSIITVPDASTDGDQLKLTLPGKNAPVLSLRLADVTAIEQTNGPVSWLSSHRPSENIHTPYLGGGAAWPARFDQAVDGAPLSFDGRVFDHGIGVHAYSRLTFAIDPQWTAFRTQYAIESQRDDPARFADVTVRIKVDDKVVYEKPHVHAGELSPVVMTDLKGAHALTLECDYGSAGDTQAHLNWLAAALLRETPATVPAAPSP